MTELSSASLSGCSFSVKTTVSAKQRQLADLFPDKQNRAASPIQQRNSTPSNLPFVELVPPYRPPSASPPLSAYRSAITPRTKKLVLLTDRTMLQVSRRRSKTTRILVQKQKTFFDPVTSPPEALHSRWKVSNSSRRRSSFPRTLAATVASS